MPGPLALAAVPSLISAAAGIFGGVSSARALKEQNKMQMAQSQKQMDFQERMSSTAHQREVKDLRAAGLNPILSGTGGAGSSSPAGSAAPIVNEKLAAIATARELAKTASEIALLQQQQRVQSNIADISGPAAKAGRGAETVMDDVGDPIEDVYEAGKDAVTSGWDSWKNWDAKGAWEKLRTGQTDWQKSGKPKPLVPKKTTSYQNAPYLEFGSKDHPDAPAGIQSRMQRGTTSMRDKRWIEKNFKYFTNKGAIRKWLQAN